MVELLFFFLCHNQVMRKIPLVLIALLLSTNFVNADDSVEGVLKGTGGVLVGAPVGFFTGLTRGAVTESENFTEAIQRGFGNETTFSKVVSYPLGVVSGGIVGAIGGAVKGVVNGIYYGVKEPFSEESFSVDGDFDDFRTFDYSSAEYGSI